MGENRVLVFWFVFFFNTEHHAWKNYKQAASSGRAQAAALIMLSQQRVPLGRLLNGMCVSCSCVLHVMPIDSCRPTKQRLGVSASCGQFPAAWPGPFIDAFLPACPACNSECRSSGPDPINYPLNPADLCCPLWPCSSYWHWTDIHGGLICKFVFE